MSVLIVDRSWDSEVARLRSYLLDRLESEYPSLWEEARKKCAAGMMPNPPCSGCAFAVAKRHGLKTEL